MNLLQQNSRTSTNHSGPAHLIPYTKTGPPMSALSSNKRSSRAQ